MIKKLHTYLKNRMSAIWSWVMVLGLILVLAVIFTFILKNVIPSSSIQKIHWHTPVRDIEAGTFFLYVFFVSAVANLFTK